MYSCKFTERSAVGCSWVTCDREGIRFGRANSCSRREIGDRAPLAIQPLVCRASARILLIVCAPCMCGTRLCVCVWAWPRFEVGFSPLCTMSSTRVGKATINTWGFKAFCSHEARGNFGIATYLWRGVNGDGVSANKYCYAADDVGLCVVGLWSWLVVRLKI
ncbi:unnamed protein product [Hapterophycus canaliculatus]